MKRCTVLLYAMHNLFRAIPGFKRPENHPDAPKEKIKWNKSPV
jgi:hypothetical protein